MRHEFGCLWGMYSPCLFPGGPALGDGVYYPRFTGQTAEDREEKEHAILYSESCFQSELAALLYDLKS